MPTTAPNRPEGPVAEGPAAVTEIDLTADEVTSPARSQVTRACGAGPGEQWKKGLTPSLLEAVRAPAALLQPKRLPSDFIAFLNRAEEDALKVASLVSSFRDLHVNFEEMSSAHAALVAQVAAVSTEKEQIATSLREAQKELLEMDKVKKELESARNELTGSKDKLAEAAAESAQKEADAAKALEKAKKDLEEMQDLVETAATQAFDNTVAQARLLNPDLVTEGMDVTSEVKDGKIVPVFFEGGEEAEAVT